MNIKFGVVLKAMLEKTESALHKATFEFGAYFIVDKLCLYYRMRFL